MFRKWFCFTVNIIIYIVVLLDWQSKNWQKISNIMITTHFILFEVLCRFQHFMVIFVGLLPNKVSYITNQWSPIPPLMNIWISGHGLKDKWPLDPMSEISVRNNTLPGDQTGDLDYESDALSDGLITIHTDKNWWNYYFCCCCCYKHLFSCI